MKKANLSEVSKIILDVKIL